jgi:hypothetical protein
VDRVSWKVLELLLLRAHFHVPGGGRCDEVKWSSTFANIFKHLVGEEFLCEVWGSTHKLVDLLFCSTHKVGCGRSLSQPILNI